MSKISIRQAGFTLIELVITIVVVAIMVMGIAGFIELGTKGYVDTVDRQQLQNQARFAVEKITREIRHAVPNSFVINGDDMCDKSLSFYPIDYAGAYGDLPITDSKQFQFVVVSAGFAGKANEANLVGKKLIVNPASQSDFDPTSSKNSFDIESVTENSNNVFTVTNVNTNDFNQGNVSGSVASRLYIYSHKVEYCIRNGGLYRNGIQVGDDIRSDSEFSNGDTDGAQSDTLARSGLVHLKLIFEMNDEVTEYDGDVQILNVP